MNFQRNNPQKLHAVIDTGSRLVRGFVFETRGADDAPRGRAKYTSYIPPVENVEERALSTIHDMLIQIIRVWGVPTSCTVGIRSDLLPTTLSLRRLQFDPPRPLMAQEDIAGAFHALFEKHAPHAAVHPLEILVNGYPGIESGFWGKKRKKRHAPQAHEIAFQTALLYGKNENGFSPLYLLPRMFAGIPLHIVPLLAAWRAALVRALSVSDSLFIEENQRNTDVLLIKDGRISAYAFYPHGRGPWMREFLAVFETCAEAGPISGHIAMSGSPLFLKECASVLGKGDWMRDVSYAERPAITLLSGDRVFSGDTAGGFLQASDDFSLAALAYHALHHDRFLTHALFV